MAHTYTLVYDLKLIVVIIIMDKNSQRSFLFFGLHALFYGYKQFLNMLFTFWQ